MPATPFYALCNTATRNGARRVGETECGRTRGLRLGLGGFRLGIGGTLRSHERGSKKDQVYPALFEKRLEERPNVFPALFGGRVVRW
eukprot:4243340-Pyramimonas_sp.AAC.2